MNRFGLAAVASLALLAGGCDTGSPLPASSPPPTPTPSATVSPTPTPSPTATASCPVGVTDGGALTTSRGTVLRVCQLPSRLLSNLTLSNTAGIVYSLPGVVQVGVDDGPDGNAHIGTAATLTIDPGVTVIADATESALIINRGSKLQAVGSATQPIIFTARQNLTGAIVDTAGGLWRGIIWAGRSFVSECGAGTWRMANCQRTLPYMNIGYGGNYASEQSGSLRFAQIRYAGAGGPDSAGLQLLAVSGLVTIDHIQVVNSDSDALNVLSGYVSMRYLALLGMADDAIDTDLNYRGDMAFIVGVQSGQDRGDAMIEADSDGNEDAQPLQFLRVGNATFLANSRTGGGNAVLIRGGADFNLFDSVLVGAQTCIDIDETGGTTTRGSSSLLEDYGPPMFGTVLMRCTDGPFRDDGNVTSGTIASLFAANARNNASYTPTLIGFVNGATENAATASGPVSTSTDIYGGWSLTTGRPNHGPTRAGYIGAVRDSADSAFQGWTCNTGYASFGAGSLCNASPL